MILWLDDPEAADVRMTGGKAASLCRMARAGLPVPEGFAVTTAAYRMALTRAGLLEGIERELASAGPAGAGAPAAAAAGLRARIQALALPPEVEAAVIDAYRRLCPGDQPVAVRSSATAEDTPAASFAGQQETYLGVSGVAAVLRRVRDCWASCFTDRAVAYRARQGVDHGGVAGAVVVQRLVDAEKAGVMFTVHPVARNPDLVVVEACWGLGEALVSGEVTPDHYTVQKSTGTVVDALVLPKRQMVVRRPGVAETAWQPVPPDRVFARVLGEGELTRLAALADQLERFFGCPQDVEWAAAGGRTYVLQSRPVTTL